MDGLQSFEECQWVVRNALAESSDAERFSPLLVGPEKYYRAFVKKARVFVTLSGRDLWMGDGRRFSDRLREFDVSTYSPVTQTFYWTPHNLVYFFEVLDHAQSTIIERLSEFVARP